MLTALIIKSCFKIPLGGGIIIIIIIMEVVICGGDIFPKGT